MPRPNRLSGRSDQKTKGPTRSPAVDEVPSCLRQHQSVPFRAQFDHCRARVG